MSIVYKLYSKKDEENQDNGFFKDLKQQMPAQQIMCDNELQYFEKESSKRHEIW